MRIALISPYSKGPMRGNITTVRRIARYLGYAGAETVDLAVDSLSIRDMERRLEDFKPDLIHGFHAHYCGAIARQLAERFQIPYVITITGSDIHDPLLRSYPATAQAIKAAQCVVCFNNNDADMLAKCFPQFGGEIIVVPQGVEPFQIVGCDNFGLASDAFVLLLPAALRPVKRVEFPLQLLPTLLQQDPTLHLVIAGGVIDQDYAASIRSMLCDTPFVTWLGEVPHERMGNLYKRADLVLNCSSSEAMSNSLMEAMALGRPVLASNISGNRSLVQDEESGWLFDGEIDFMRLVLQIRGNKDLREERGRRARESMMTNFSPQVEAERYLSLYSRLA